MSTDKIVGPPSPPPAAVPPTDASSRPLRLALLGGCLEPGRDGVGDYLAQVAEIAEQQGHAVLRIGLQDCLNEETPGQLLRLDRVEALGIRRARIVAWLRDFQPDWTSWHLVPYAYHPKGILPHRLAKIVGLPEALGRRHVFAHELWIGEERGAPWRHRLWRQLQRPRFRSFLRDWRPERVDTTNVVYRTLLARIGQTSGLVPLFGNLPPTRQPLAPGLLPDATPRPWVVAFFGTLHPAWDPAPTTQFLRAVAETTGRPVHCLGLGRLGPHGEAWFRRLPPGLTGQTTGSRPAPEISAALQAADFAVATHPWALLGKSGAVAAYLDHGLPVLATRDDWHLRSGHPEVPPPGPGVVRLTDLDPAAVPAWVAAHRRPAQDRRADFVATWLASLG